MQGHETHASPITSESRSGGVNLHVYGGHEDSNEILNDILIGLGEERMTEGVMLGIDEVIPCFKLVRVLVQRMSASTKPGRTWQPNP